jgi:hypothetical protein
VEVGAGTDPTNRFEFPGSSAPVVPMLPGPGFWILALGLLATLLLLRGDSLRQSRPGSTSSR